jgi:hypothetical protein
VRNSVTIGVGIRTHAFGRAGVLDLVDERREIGPISWKIKIVSDRSRAEGLRGRYRMVGRNEGKGEQGNEQREQCWPDRLASVFG